MSLRTLRCCAKFSAIVWAAVVAGLLAAGCTSTGAGRRSVPSATPGFGSSARSEPHSDKFKKAVASDPFPSAAQAGVSGP
jgi:hypothetical protein